MNRHKGLEWGKIQAKLEANTEKLWSLNEKELAVNRMLLVIAKRQGNTFFMIVQQKVLKAAEMFVTTAKCRRRGRSEGVHPEDNATDIAAAMGIEILTEEQYRELKNLNSIRKRRAG